MKQTSLKGLVILVIMVLIVGVLPLNSKADNEFENPSSYEINKLLTQLALQNKVPPEIVKAVAYKESDWEQFENNKPKISSDGGIGIMQVTDTAGFNEEKLKTSISYNIQAGIDILNEKWEDGVEGKINWDSSSIPTIGDNSRDVLEHWYFAVMAYNGKVEVNSPVIKSDGSGDRNYKTYQDEVYEVISKANNFMFDKDRIAITFDKSDFDYTGEPYNLLKFNKRHYELNDVGHKTKHKFSKGDLVISAEGSNFREAPTTKSRITSELPDGKTEVLEVLKPFEYDVTYKIPSNVKWEDQIANHYGWYFIERSDNQRAYAASGPLTYIGKRIAGDNRYKTAIDISQQGWKDGADTVVLARGYDYPDALAGAPLAYKENAPLLLTDNKELTKYTKKEIERLKPKEVIILGGRNAVGEAVKEEVDRIDSVDRVTRIGGSGRYETAQLIAERVNPNPDKAIIAYGRDFPDALSIAPYAARKGYPILLTETNELPKATKEALRGINGTIVIGGEAVISKKVMENLPNDTERVSGKDRFGTSVAIANKFSSENPDEKVFIATGKNFADALAGSVLAAKQSAPLLLTEEKQLPVSVKNVLIGISYREYTLLGGRDVVGVEQEIGDIFK
jgi:putative cell wall-binding protein